LSDEDSKEYDEEEDDFEEEIPNQNVPQSTVVLQPNQIGFQRPGASQVKKRIKNE